MSSTVIGTCHPAWRRYEDTLTHGTTYIFQPMDKSPGKEDRPGILLVVSWHNLVPMVEYLVSKCRAASRVFWSADGSHALTFGSATSQLICPRISLLPSSLVVIQCEIYISLFLVETPMTLTTTQDACNVSCSLTFMYHWSSASQGDVSQDHARVFQSTNSRLFLDTCLWPVCGYLVR